jgi:cytochrome c553
MFVRCVSTTIAAGVMFALAGVPAQAQGDIEAKVQVCSVCHGANGQPISPATIPNIWGQQPYYLFKQLVNYRDGMREHAIMTPIAKGLQQADLRAIANYFAAKPWPPHATPANPGAQPNGMAMCVPCHQAKFEGGPSWPRLAGLNADYLLGAMRAFAKEERTNNGDMPKIMQMYTDAQMEAMAKYLAAL